MSHLLATLFVDPLPMAGMQRLLLLLPLCLSISIVYKTTKCDEVRAIPMDALKNWITIVVGMVAVGVSLLIIYELLA